MYESEAAWKWRLKAQMLRSRADAMQPSLVKSQFIELAAYWERKANVALTAPWAKPADPNNKDQR